jgi:hypothetical protein
MMKKAKTAMSSTADTATQALVFEFLHGFEDVLHDLGEMKEKSGPEAPPFGSGTGSYVDSAATHDDPLHFVEAEQNIISDDQEVQYQENEDLHTVEQDTLSLEPMDEENHSSDNMLLGVEENYVSDSLAIENCAAEEYVIPQHNEDADQAGHPADMEHSLVLLEHMAACEENSSFDAAPSPGPSSPALAAVCDSATENGGLDRPGAQQSDDAKLEDKDVTVAEHTDANDSNGCNGVSSSDP